MRISDLLLMSINNLRRRKLRTALTVLGVVIGTASIVVMLSLGIGLNEMNRELIESYGSLTTIEVRLDRWGNDSGGDTAQLTDEVVADFLKIPHVESVYPALEASALLKQGNYEANVSIVGMPREFLEQIPLGQGSISNLSDDELMLIYGNAVIQWFYNSKTKKGYWESGELPEVDYMGQSMFAVFDMDQYYEYLGGGGTAPKKYIIESAGVVEGDISDYSDYAYSIYADIDVLKAKLKTIFKKNPIPGQPTNSKGKPYSYFVYNLVKVNVDEIDHVMEVQTYLTDQGYQAYSNVEWMEQSEKQSAMIQAVLGGIGAISLFVAAIGIANTMMMSIYERTKEIGVIKVLGCDMGTIRNMFLIESGFIGLMGGLIGLLFSYGVGFLMNHVLNLGGMMGMGGMAGDISRIPPWLAISAVTFSIVIGMVAGFFPSLRAMKLSPLAAIRNQ